jgi:hypothetical protein
MNPKRTDEPVAPPPIRRLTSEEIAQLNYKPPRKLPGESQAGYGAALKRWGSTPGGRAFMKGRQTARENARQKDADTVQQLVEHDGGFVNVADLAVLYPGARVRVLGKRPHGAMPSMGISSRDISVEDFIEANEGKMFFLTRELGNLWPVREDGSVMPDCCAAILEHEEDDEVLDG